jgi:hypothetical protein
MLMILMFFRGEGRDKWKMMMKNEQKVALTSHQDDDDTRIGYA